MITLITPGRKMLLLSFLLATASEGFSQVQYQAYANIHSSVNGTSTLHDWTMKSSTGQCKATFTLNAANELTGLTDLNLSIPAASLKSKNKSMDKNAYKALKIKDHEAITFDLTSATVSADGLVKCQGKLTIAGTTVNTELLATAKPNPDKSIAITGTKKISMKEYNMVPPTFMLGAVKTGNDITLNFDLTLTKL